jgi:HAMP domain-containing protein
VSIVDANYRFIAAAQEANARIAQRQQALALYVTITLSLIAAMVALSRPVSEHANSSAIPWLLLGFPLASLCLWFLNFKSEAALANIRRFLSELEQLDNAHERLPSFNTDARWAASANRARRYHDFASAALTAGAHAIAIAVAITTNPGHPYVAGLAAVTAIAGAILTVALLIVPRWRYQPSAKA